eukprot:8488297-Alexandrium_andersonii.AAC.1
MRAVEGQPPEAPNAYMDGSVSEPSRPERALGGVGVWAPQASEDAVLPAFHDFYQPVAYSGGFGMFGALGGGRMSSTRAETAACLMACYIEQPLHLAVDNANVYRRASA